MKILTIEWRHLDVEGETCERCFDTGENLKHEIMSLNSDLNPKGYEVKLVETKLTDADVNQSNSVLFNGVPIEDILNIEVSDSYCESCSDLLNAETYCRTVVYEGQTYEDIPIKAIKDAAHKALGLKPASFEFKMAGGCCCQLNKS